VIPAKITAGDTLDFLSTVDDYPATDGWTLTHQLIPRVSGDRQSFDAIAEGSDYRSTVAATTTADWTAGAYSWVAYVTLAGVRHTVQSGMLTIVADPAEADAGYDPRTHARKALDALEAMIEGKATKDQLGYTINGRELRRMTWPDILTARSQYKAEVRAEEQAERVAAGLPDRRKLYVRLLRA
jgi:hypothetical protein